MRIRDFKVFQSQVICWCLFVSLAVLAAAWGFVSIEVTKPFTDAERGVIGIIAVVFAFLAALFLRLAVRSGRKRDDHAAQPRAKANTHDAGPFSA
jgi:hypothetical protein